MHVNSQAWAEENKLKYEKVSFLLEMSEINSRWVIFNLLEWALFKSVRILIIHFRGHLHVVLTDSFPFNF